jgi:hypothetical protein
LKGEEVASFCNVKNSELSRNISANNTSSNSFHAWLNMIDISLGQYVGMSGITKHIAVSLSNR